MNMPTFRYQATSHDGRLVEGEYAAATPEAVLDYLERRELIPLSVASPNEARGLNWSLPWFQGVAPLDRIVIIRNLSVSLSAGLSLAEALEILISDFKKPALKTLLAAVKGRIENGESLSSSLRRQGGIFSEVILGMIEAGESSGRLAETLNELSVSMLRDYGLVRKVRSALTYPAILLLASFLTVSALLGFVVPRLARFFAAGGVKLPPLTQFLVNTGTLLSANPLVDFLVLAVLVGGLGYLVTAKRGQELLAAFAYRVPIASKLVKKIVLVRTTRMVGYLLAGGKGLTEALLLASSASGLKDYREAYERAVKDVKLGITLSRSLENQPELFPKFLTNLVSVGERTGTLEQVLKTFSNFYDDEVEAALKDLTTVIEPVLLAFMGLVVGTVVLSILLPIYTLVGSFT